MRKCRGKAVLAVILSAVLSMSGINASAAAYTVTIEEGQTEADVNEVLTEENSETVYEETEETENKEKTDKEETDKEKTEETTTEIEPEEKSEHIQTESETVTEEQTEADTIQTETEFETETDTIQTETEFETETETLTDEEQKLTLAEITVNEYAGYEEGAYAKWKPVDGADGYIVYISKDNNSWTEIDDALIRSYGSYMRADALGLTSGKWYLKIEAAAFNSSNEKQAAVAEKTLEVSVSAHDRSGFAWENGTASGAYNEDGSLKKNAKVLYVTEKTKDTVKMDVNGAGTCKGIQTILDGYKKGKETTPLCIRVIGNVTQPSYTLNDDLVIENKQTNSIGITIEGIGDDATANGWGIRLKNASNVEIRNIGFMNRSSVGEKDNIGLQQKNDHVWVHHCDMFYGNAGKDADQIKGDGALDCKKSNYVTFSYNHFWDSGKCSLLGLSEGTNDLYVTYHHNWFDHSDSRHPRIRFFTTHVYNNYYDGNAKYGIGGAKGGASIYSENNYFRNCKYPMLISMQGSDVWDGTKNDYTNSPTFSKEDGSIIKAYGNIMTGEKRFIPYSATDDTATAWDESVDFDAYVVENRTDKVPSTVKTAYGKFTYNNFDTETDCYIAKNDYKLDKAEDVPEIVKANAGRLNGGDFKWSFSTQDDTAYEVNMELKNKLLNYKTSLVSVGGRGDYGTDDDDGDDDGGKEDDDGKDDDGGNDGDVTEITDSAIIYDITKDGLKNEYFEVTGSIKKSTLTSAEYNGMSFTGSPLKMESKTSIKFVTSVDATLVLLFEAGKDGKVKIDGTETAITAGVVNTRIEPAAHELTKGSSENLFAIIIIPDSDNEEKPGEESSKEEESSEEESSKEEKSSEEETSKEEESSEEESSKEEESSEEESSKEEKSSEEETSKEEESSEEESSKEEESSEEESSEEKSSEEESSENDETVVNTEGLKVTLLEKGKSYTYTGSAITPEIIVTNNGEPLTEGTDYIVKYSDNIKSGNAKITITGKNNLAGSCSAEFKIERKNIADDDVQVGNTVIESGKKASPALAHNGIKLGAKDYTVSNTEKLTQSREITLKGTGNYTGERKVFIEVVNKENLKKFKVSTDSKKEPVYSAASLKEQLALVLSVTDAVSGMPLDKDNYEIVFPKNTTDAGKVKLTVIGKNAYTGSVTKNVNIKPLTADGKIEAVVNPDGYEYTSSGAVITDLVVNYKSADDKTVKLKKGKDYKVSYSANNKAGTAKYTLSFMGNYKGTKPLKGSYRIKKADLSKARVTAADMIYTGKPGKYYSKPYVTLNGGALNSSDYTVKYYKDKELSREFADKLSMESGVNEMTVYIKVTGAGNCDADTYAFGSYKLCRSTTQTADMSKVKVSFTDEKGAKLKKAEYTGKEITPTVKVTYKINGRSYTLNESCYTVSYVNNIEKGKATAIVTATGVEDENIKCAFAGSKTAAFTIASRNLNNVKEFLSGLFKSMGYRYGV